MQETNTTIEGIVEVESRFPLFEVGNMQDQFKEKGKKIQQSATNFQTFRLSSIKKTRRLFWATIMIAVV